MINYEWTAAKFFYFFFFMFFTVLSFTYYGMMSIAITPNVQLSTMISSTILAFSNLFSGFLIPRPVNKKVMHLTKQVVSCWLLEKNL
jgi:ABC-type multidrug transport system permease subunit